MAAVGQSQGKWLPNVRGKPLFSHLHANHPGFIVIFPKTLEQSKFEIRREPIKLPEGAQCTKASALGKQGEKNPTP